MSKPNGFSTGGAKDWAFVVLEKVNPKNIDAAPIILLNFALENTLVNSFTNFLIFNVNLAIEFSKSLFGFSKNLLSFFIENFNCLSFLA